MKLRCRYYPCKIINQLKKRGTNPRVWCPCENYEEKEL